MGASIARRITLILLSGLWLGPASAADTKPSRTASKAEIPAEAKATLEAAGLKVTTSGLTLPEETEFGKSIRDAAKQKKTMMGADREVYAVQREVDDIKAQIAELKTQYKDLNVQLASLPAGTPNGRLVGAINATVTQIEELQEASRKAGERLKDARKKAGEVRDEFVQELLTMRSQANAIPEKWTAFAADDAVKGAVDAVNKALGTKFALQPASSFTANNKQLKNFEDAVSSQAIKLDNETNSLWVNVTINDKHKQRMIVDSGANTLSLPDKMARDMGIKAETDGVPMRVILADGRQVPALMIKLDSVRVGKFTVQDVECCVLGPDATDAPPLLGMSFLGQFKFEVDANQAELKLLKVESGEPQPKDKSKDKAKAAKKKKQSG
jgi:aspartyl protease family protein